MISFNVSKNGSSISNIEVKGHASSDYGTDILCASVSTAIVITVNAIEKIGLIDNIDYQLKEGLFDLKVIKNNGLLNQLLENLEYSLEDLKNQYPNKFKK